MAQVNVIQDYIKSVMLVRLNNPSRMVGKKLVGTKTV